MITTYNASKYKLKSIEGIKVHYLPVYYDNHLGFIGRIFSFIKFYFLAVKLSRTIKDVDLIYAMTTPLTVGLIAMSLKRILSLPFYFEVGDFWPEAPIQMGFVKNVFVKSFGN